METMKSSLLASASAWWCLLLLCAPAVNATYTTRSYNPLTGLTADACFPSYTTVTAAANTEFHAAAGCTVSGKTYKVMFSSFDGRWQFSPRNIVNGNTAGYVGRWQEGSYSSAGIWVGTTTTVNPISFNGEWVMIGLPANLILTTLAIAGGNVVTYELYGSATAGTWAKLTTTPVLTSSVVTSMTLTAASVYYNSFLLVVSQISSGSTALTMSSITVTGSTCPAGSWEGTAASACTQCAAGKYYATEGTQVASTPCQDCPAGKYEALTGKSVCTDCPAGKFRISTAGTSLTSCTDCSVGKYSTSTGLIADCSNTCAAGKYAAAGATVCTDCPAGTEVGGSDLASCTDCADSKTSIPGSTTCRTTNDCPAGYSKTLKACNPCAVGTIIATDSHMTGACTACDNGQYAPLASSACYDCPAGSYGSTTQICTCTKCGAGKYRTAVKATASSDCTPCGIGKYSIVVGSASANNCYPCPLGTYSASATGVSICTDCAAGKYSSWGAAVCTNCPAGKYSTAAASTVCLDCAAGTTCAAGATTCGSCS
jgi:hypothetical protein